MKKRIFAALLCVIMLFGMLPITALAAEPKTIYVDATEGNDKNNGSKDLPYATVEKAVTEAESGDTIQLGEGNYTLYGVDSTGHTKGKDLTFVGQGADKTAWNIGAEVPNPYYFGTEYNSDYSFDGAGTVTFQDMTLRSGTANYLGFTRPDNTVVENCTINGKTFYWGYKSATFTNTTFNCPSGDYALWTYSSPTMTFENCTFNSSGKVINVYNEGGTPNIVVNFSNCRVNNEGFSLKPVLNINDAPVKSFTINISGNISVSGVDPDGISCSRLFGFGYARNNQKKTVVNFNGETVWENGSMVDEELYHNSGVTVEGVSYNNGVSSANEALYAEGYKDDAFHFEINSGAEWRKNGDHYVAEGTLVCNYCGYAEPAEGKGYLVSYDLNGGEGNAWTDYADKIVGEGTSIYIKSAPTKENDKFVGWYDGRNRYEPWERVTVKKSMKLVARWESEGNIDDTDNLAEIILGAITVLGLDTDDHIAYVYGYPDGTVRPNETITRAEVTTIFYRLLTSARRDEIFTSENSFRDVNSSLWYNKAASSMAAGGYIQGYADGTFGANKPITRAEFVCLAARFATKTTGFASYTDVDNGHWAARSIAICASNGWVQGYEDGTFRPDQPITRAEAMTIINRMLGRGVSKGYVCKGAARFTDNDPGSWYYYEILEATNDHEYRNARPFEQWIRATILRSYDMDKYERP